MMRAYGGRWWCAHSTNPPLDALHIVCDFYARCTHSRRALCTAWMVILCMRKVLRAGLVALACMSAMHFNSYILVSFFYDWPIWLFFWPTLISYLLHICDMRVHFIQPSARPYILPPEKKQLSSISAFSHILILRFEEIINIHAHLSRWNLKKKCIHHLVRIFKKRTYKKVEQ